MNLEKYQLKAERDLTIFEFVSDGVRGKIPKIIEYTETNLKGFYNLAFGDKNELTGKIKDQIKVIETREVIETIDGKEVTEGIGVDIKIEIVPLVSREEDKERAVLSEAKI